MALDRPFNDGCDQTANVAVSASTVSANKTDDLIFMFRAKRPLYLRHFRLNKTAETDVSGKRRRSKTAELHTAAPNELELGEGGKAVRAGHRLGSGVGG